MPARADVIRETCQKLARELEAALRPEPELAPRKPGGMVSANPPESYWRWVATTCGACGYRYYRFEDGPNACPQCAPGQPKPLGERVTDPADFLGPSWVWQEDRGPRGRWVHRDELFITSASFLAELRAMAELLPERDCMLSVVVAVKAELERLRARVAQLEAPLHVVANDLERYLAEAKAAAGQEKG